MLDVGFSEILLTSAIALIVLGPERLPKVARQVGNWMGRARAMARQLSEQLEREVIADELLKAQNKPSPAANPPNIGGAVYPQYTPPSDAAPPSGAAPSSGIAPPSGVASPSEAAPPSAAAPLSAAAAPIATEPVYGLDAALTTPAAMHASDPPVADSIAAATDPKPPHE